MAQIMEQSDLAMLREYVTAPGNFGANQSDSTVLLHVTHSNLKAEFMEIRLDKHVRASPSHERQWFARTCTLRACHCISTSDNTATHSFNSAAT